MCLTPPAPPLQAPVAAVLARVQQLLNDWPDHPILAQLAAICRRLLAFPATVPLKQALTGVELLLARAQLWQETAAKHVSIADQLTAVAAVATRWRRLELASWRLLLQRVVAVHAAGAHRSWFYLYQLLAAAGQQQPAAEEEEAEGGLLAGSSAFEQLSPEEAAYRRCVTTLEAFLQTSTIGEFSQRLRLLRAFLRQLQYQQQQGQGQQGQQALGDLVCALQNLSRYYGQFEAAVSEAQAAGLAPIQKDLLDFVRLAKWEDRGYYAMKAATEKAQRYLHRWELHGGCLLSWLASWLCGAFGPVGVQSLCSHVGG
jgi:midasin